MKTDLADRLSTLRIDMDPATLGRQIAATSAALKEPLRQVPPAARRRMRLAPILAGLAIFAAPLTGVAVAAESSIPGEALYRVKQVTEQVRSWFDPGVLADHRLDELETVLSRDAGPDEVAARLAAADEAVAELTIDDARSQTFDTRLDAARNRAQDRLADDTAPTEGPGGGVGDRSPGDESDPLGPNPSDSEGPGQQRGGAEDDQPPATRDRGDEPARTTSTTSTTVPPRDDGRSGGGDGAPGGDGSSGDAPGDGSSDQPPRRGDG